MSFRVLARLGALALLLPLHLPAVTGVSGPRVPRPGPASILQRSARNPLDDIYRGAEAIGPNEDGLVELVSAIVAGSANDNFANAAVITTSAGDAIVTPILGDNINATKEPGEPNHGGNAGGHSVWWKWTAPANVNVTLYSGNSTFATALAVYTGSAVNALTPITPDPYTAPAPEGIFFFGLAGTTYYFAVDGIDGAQGTVQLDLATNGTLPPVITTQPADASVAAYQNNTIGQNIVPVMQVTATGSAPLTYQWFHNNVAVGPASSGWSSLSFQSLSSSDAGSYYVVVSNPWGSVTSVVANLTVTGDPKPVITTQPVSQSLSPGQLAAFVVAATGGGDPLSYQWFFNGAAIAGAGSPTLSLPNVQGADAGSYTVTVSSSSGSVTSDAAVLTVFSVATKPVITAQPADQKITAGANAAFSVTASGFPAVFSYQWFYNGAPIGGATAATLILGNVQSADAGSYSVNVTNPGGTTASNAATLTINPAAVTPPSAPPSSGGGGGGGGGGAPSWWFLTLLSLLPAFRNYTRQRQKR